MTIYPVILSGGSGTRLWPLSRSMYPKQFIPFFGKEEPSFLGATLRRLSADSSVAAPTILCNNDHRFLVRAECEAAGIEPKMIVLEPQARNTAPAITAAAMLLVDEDPDAVLCVMPSDHLIGDAAGFLAGVVAAAGIARQGRLVLFGITPTEANTGYGYIQTGALLDGDSGAAHVLRFAEKPDIETAERYLASGGYLWNSGIFLLHGRTFLAEVARLEPEMFAAVRDSVDGATRDLAFTRLDQSSFARARSVSVDYAVMERTDHAVVLPLAVGWSDVGSWGSLWEASSRDGDGNAIHSEAVMIDTQNTYVHSDRSLVATLGVSDLIIVDTPDALLVADRSRSQEVGTLVQQLKQSGRREHEQHLRNHRPWGYFETLSLQQRFQVKMLHVTPGSQLSMQMHHHRSEHWIVVKGTAKVTVGDEVRFARENESLYIQATQWHRLENPGKVPLELIEVQIGSYLGEDDIVRRDDIYNRGAEETK
ncbi:xanthan biosynthesis protein XanB [Aureimonas sp. SA4125]|uniref:mannose-1-phosphate guanylyltransferase/mannose-6-phosphate isomerase n=1 Tax=Aureimonas sp. SA4125 TaxID=2826993 RepID=UPI001CC66226|nr:mannose-1-phosphate guanylyltransferase/mannose-6-phosphate isomerase [Aureimonas sp. SA4125]BDA83335.1 xanthan biosynthesis protein XanB [Aureimonas sp. SA4125]